MEPIVQQSPKQFLRQRRPERFSDTKHTAHPILDRSALEYHLSTLTNRNQESDFQNFAFKLAQRAICPNLRPQTGPTGGGDSKADAETFPVADQLSLAWYTGKGREAASKRWAFAFSAMKKWEGKVESDVKKIAETARGYSEVFFVSSQFIPDKKRATVEDHLKKEYKFDRVTMCDRNWILDQVFEGGHEELAITELKISVPPTPVIEVGPLDAQRRKALDDAETQINSLLASDSSGTRLVWFAIEAARLARELELPRSEVDGRYRRAIDLSDKYGSDRQKIEARYQFAWSTFWWQEDFPKFNDLYSEVEALAMSSESAPDLKLLYNLWHLLSMLKFREVIPTEKLRWNERLMVLAQALDKISKSDHLPSAALEARAMLLLQQITVTYPNVPSNIFDDLKSVLENCDGLIGFPLQQTVDLITEMGDLITNDDAFDSLCESVASVLGEREGDSASAIHILRRSFQKLNSNHNYDAIELAGRSLTPLWKKETQTELVDALYVCATAYQRIDLLWAARGSWLSAASIMVNNFHEHPEPDAFRVGCFSRLKWTELLLGRLPHLLAWHQAEHAVRSVTDDSTEVQADDFKLTDGCLAILLLRSDLNTLRQVELLPNVLAANGFPLAFASLLYALGWEAKARNALSAPDDDSLSEFFLLLRDQPAWEDLPSTLELGDGDTVTFHSFILGIHLRITTDNKEQCNLLAESFLAALESALATAFREHLIPVVSTINVTISIDETAPFPFLIEPAVPESMPDCTVRCPSFVVTKLRREDQGQIKDKLLELISRVLVAMAPTPDLFEKLKRLFGENGGVERALNFTSSIVTLTNVLGSQPATRLGDWAKPELPRYALKRERPWDFGLKPRPPKKSTSENVTPEDSEARERDEISHKKMGVFTVINMRLWDEAEWYGTVYANDPTGERPPILAIGYRNIDAGSKIFQEWHERFGDRDVNDSIKITIIKGISTSNPSAYRVLISANPSDEEKKDKTHFVMMNRSHTMNASNTNNQDNFLRDARRFGGYFFGFAKLSNTTEGNPAFELVYENMIIKEKIAVREAWSIGLHDSDCMGISSTDDPVIPTGVESPPVSELLVHLRSLRQSQD